MKANVMNVDKKGVGEVELADEIFGAKISKPLLYEVIKMQLSNRRMGCAATRTHKDVSGTTAKMYRQKGTGRARHGDARTNIFVGGGKAFGPHPRSYKYRIPAKARRSGIRSALSQKQKDGKLLILDDFPCAKIKTSDAVKRLVKLGISSGLFIAADSNEKFEKSVRNIAGIKIVKSEGINVYDIMSHEHTIILKDALGRLEEVLKP